MTRAWPSWLTGPGQGRWRHRDLSSYSVHFSVRLTLLQLAAALLVLWLVLGDPMLWLANLFYQHEPAPWESVDLEYYPSGDRDEQGIVLRDLPGMQECYNQAQFQAAQHGDAALTNSSWVCRIVHSRAFGRERIGRHFISGPEPVLPVVRGRAIQ